MCFDVKYNYNCRKATSYTKTGARVSIFKHEKIRREPCYQDPCSGITERELHAPGDCPDCQEQERTNPVVNPYERQQPLAAPPAQVPGISQGSYNAPIGYANPNWFGQQQPYPQQQQYVPPAPYPTLQPNALQPHLIPPQQPPLRQHRPPVQLPPLQTALQQQRISTPPPYYQFQNQHLLLNRAPRRSPPPAQSQPPAIGVGPGPAPGYVANPRLRQTPRPARPAPRVNRPVPQPPAGKVAIPRLPHTERYTPYQRFERSRGPRSQRTQNLRGPVRQPNPNQAQNPPQRRSREQTPR